MKQTIAILFVGLISHGAYALRCGNQLVYDGDSKAQVIAKCEEPMSSDGDIYGDKQELTYDGHDGSNTTVKFLNGHVVDTETSRQ